MEPRIVTKSAFTVVGMTYHGRAENKEIPRLWGALEQREGELEHVVNQRTSYGISANVNMETGEFDYVAGFEVTDADNVPRGMVRFDVPGGRYAVFSTTLSTIGETFDYAYQIWLPQSGHQATRSPDFEIYGPDFDPRDPNSEFQLCVSIQ